MTDEEIILGGILGAGLGYILGNNPYTEWKGFIDKVGERVNHLAFMKIVIPQGLFSEIPNCQEIYAESVRSFAYGLPNASIPLLYKCLELGLRKKYEDAESKSTLIEIAQKKSSKDLNGYQLIDWAEQYLGNKKELAQGFRIIRNILHEDAVILEQEVLLAMYNISQIINILFPYQTASISFNCRMCKRPETTRIPAEQNFLGNVLLISCMNCRTSSNIRIFV